VGVWVVLTYAIFVAAGIGLVVGAVLGVRKARVLNADNESAARSIVRTPVLAVIEAVRGFFVAGFGVVIAILAVAGCGGGGSDGGSPPGAGTGQPQVRHGRLAPGSGAGGVRLEKLGDFNQPLYVAQPPGDRRDLFVVEQTGRIQILRDGHRASRPFLDLSGAVSCCGEQGLLSVAFAPNYRKSGLLYVDYTDAAGDTRVVEYRRSSSDPLRGDPASRRVVLRVPQPFSVHNGGLLLFGPDHLLYVGLGDGGAADHGEQGPRGDKADPQRNGQDLSTLLGKILRIDPRPSGDGPYAIPRSNPFVGRHGARPEIYSYGLRNPWRFSFDRATGALAIGDVGGIRFEEVDLVPRGDGRGANFGWSAYEGFARLNADQHAPNQIPPALVYRHDAGCSVTGGYVVRDRALPTLFGRYLYGDYCSGVLRSFPAQPAHPAADDRALGPTVPSLSSFGEDDAGHIYATSLQGPVYRLVPSGH
jgi:glucose/arabinose dehydrogenase